MYSSISSPSSENHDASGLEPCSALLGEVTVERAKSVVVVIRGIDETAAEKVLLGVAHTAGVPLSVASGQVLLSLQSRSADDVLTSEALDTAFGAVSAVELIGDAWAGHV